jgi:hypothetical protein
MNIFRLTVYILLLGISLRFFRHWFLQLRRMSEVDEPQRLLRFLRQEGRFYNSQLLICVAALILGIWSYNVNRSVPQHVTYAPISELELRLWDQTGAWDIGLGIVEIILLLYCLWALSQAVRASAQIKILWAVRDKLGLDMSEYRVQEK